MREAGPDIAAIKRCCNQDSLIAVRLVAECKTISEEGSMNQPHLTEKEITHQIRSVLKTMRVFHWKVWQGLGSERGVPDIVGIINGRFFGIEIKGPHGKLSEHQEKFIKRIQDAGGIAFVAKSVDDVLAGLNLKKAVLF